MSKHSLIDYSGYTLFRFFGPLIRILPLKMAMSLGRMLGGLIYYLDFKHRAVAYANIKTAFSGRLSPQELKNIARKFYQAFGQNLIEVFLIPLIDKDYINKYISIEGLNYISEGFKKGKGIILLGMHEGSWELSNIICANLGFAFSLFIQDQRHPRLNQLLNLYRKQKGCKIIQRQNQLQQLIQALKNNEAIGMTADQGGKAGTLVKFLGKDASMSSGAIRLALKYDVALIPAFYKRIKGPYIKVIIEPPFELKKTQDLEMDVRDNLQEVVRIFQRHILKYPQEYLWLYKIWKYSRERKILILSDAKTGHLRQSQAVAEIVKNYFKDKGTDTKISTLEIKFKNRFSRKALVFSSCLAGKYHCQGCLWCLKTFLEKDNYKSLISTKPDMVISCGSALAPINFIISRENLAKSIVIMRPSILSAKRFDLVVMPRHDNPPRRKNIIVTEGALNLISEDYLKEQAARLIQATGYTPPSNRQELSPLGLYIGLLIGGDTKGFSLEKDTVLEVIRQVKSASEKQNTDILATTSRRTSRGVEEIVKKEFKDYPRCKLIIIANERNIPSAMGGILALSQVIVTSPESISMISEAANSQKYVLVFDSSKVGVRHRRFLGHLAKNKYIYLTEPSNLSKTIEDVWTNKPAIHTLEDNLLVAEAIRKIL